MSSFWHILSQKVRYFDQIWQEIVAERSLPVVIWFSIFHWNQILSFCRTKMCDFITKSIGFWIILTPQKESGSPRNEKVYIFWMSSIFISIPIISIYWLRAHKIIIFPGQITILIFMFWAFSESNLRIHLLFAHQTQFEKLFKTSIYLLDASRNFWKFFKFQILKITLSSVSALLWLSFNFFGGDFQKVKNTKHLVPGDQKSEISRKNHHKKIKRDQKVIRLKVPNFVGAVKFLAT